MKLQKASSHAERNRAANMRAGFTLLELILVIATSSILFVMTVTTSVNFYQNQLVDDTTQNLKSTLRRARAYAMAERNASAYGLKLLTASSTLVIFRGATYATRVSADDEAIDYPSFVTITSTSTEVTFSRLYGTSTVNEVWSLTGGSVNGAVRINSQGNVEIQ